MNSKSQQYSRLLAFSLPFPTRTGLFMAVWANEYRYAGHSSKCQCRVQRYATHAQQLYCLRKVHDCTCNTDTDRHLYTSQPLVTMHFQQLPQCFNRQFYHRKSGLKCCTEFANHARRICNFLAQNSDVPSLSLWVCSLSVSSPAPHWYNTIRCVWCKWTRALKKSFFQLNQSLFSFIAIDGEAVLTANLT